MQNAHGHVRRDNPPMVQRSTEQLHHLFSRIFQTLNEEMVVAAFVKGLWVSPFSDSLLQKKTESMAEVRERATAHIEVEKAIQRKNMREQQEDKAKEEDKNKKCFTPYAQLILALSFSFTWLISQHTIHSFQVKLSIITNTSLRNFI